MEKGAWNSHTRGGKASVNWYLRACPVLERPALEEDEHIYPQMAPQVLLGPMEANLGRGGSRYPILTSQFIASFAVPSQGIGATCVPFWLPRVLLVLGIQPWMRGVWLPQPDFSGYGLSCRGQP